MAQDFGDDIGEAMLRTAERFASDLAKNYITEQIKVTIKAFHEKRLAAKGLSKNEAQAAAEVLASRKNICMPFGNSTDASYFAQVCRENEVGAFALTDDKGNGYILFAEDDLELVKNCTGQFSEVMSSLKNREIAEMFDKGQPVSRDVFKTFKPVADQPDIPKPLDHQTHDVTLIPVALRFKDSPDKVEVMTFSEQGTEDLDIDGQVFFSGYTHGQLKDMVGKETGEDFTIESVGEPYQVKARKVDPTARVEYEDGRTEGIVDNRANDAYSHTEGIRDKVLAAREQCRDLDDFKELLAKDGIGVTETKNGELMFYEARRGKNGEILPRGKNEEGLMDWAVGAKTLRDRWKCDASHDWFKENTPKEPSTPVHEAVHDNIPPQKDLNLICNAVRGDLMDRGIPTLDRPDGKMGFVVDIDYKQQVLDAVEKRFPGHTPEELGIILEPHHDIGSMTMEVQEPQVTDGSLDMNGATPDLNQGFESHDGMDTATNTARMERELSNTDVAPSTVRESSQPRLKEVEKECRAASKQLSQTNDSPDRDISDKFQQER